MLIAQWGSGLADGLRIASQALLKPVQLDPFRPQLSRIETPARMLQQRVGPFKDDAICRPAKELPAFWDLEDVSGTSPSAICSGFIPWTGWLEIEEQSQNKITRRIASSIEKESQCLQGLRNIITPIALAGCAQRFSAQTTAYCQHQVSCLVLQPRMRHTGIY